MNNDIVLFETKDGSLAMPVQVKAETVWLTQAQKTWGQTLRLRRQFT